MGAYRTPLIDKLKTDAATFYTFGSPIEDIGLNINERSNKVALSHYVLLNLPGIVDGIGGSGTINTDNFDPKLKSEGVKNWIIPKILQNYALNFETMLRNRSAYDYSATKTVSERVFWKMLQKSGAINFLPYKGNDNETYYHEDFSNPENTVIKGYGQITTSSQSSNTYNMNNETYIMIPSSYGQMKYYMKSVSDNNCSTTGEYKNDTTNNTYLENHDEDSVRTYVDNGNTYTIDTPYYDSDYKYKNTKDTDCLEFEFDTENIKNYLKSENPNEPTGKISYDDIAIDDRYCLSNTYSFNTILVYYTIYDTNSNPLSTNLFGVMVLASPKEGLGDGVSFTFQPSKIDGTSTDIVGNHIKFEGQKVDTSDKFYVNETLVTAYNANLAISTTSSAFYAKGYSAIIGGDINSISVYDGKTTTTISSTNLSNGKSNNDKIKISKIVAYKNGVVSEDTKNIKTMYKITVTFEESASLSNKQLISITRNQASKYSEAANVEVFGVTNNGGTTTLQLNIPSYIKKKTTSGSFGSEYSFRLNIQTASIYDKNSEIIDYSTGLPGVLDDFNGVLSNLKTAVDVLTSNSILQAKIYDDFLATKTLLVTALSEIETIKQDIKNIQSQIPNFDKNTGK